MGEEYKIRYEKAGFGALIEHTLDRRGWVISVKDDSHCNYCEVASFEELSEALDYFTIKVKKIGDLI